MKIVIITNNGGGLYLFRRELVGKLIAQGDRVHVSVPEDEFTERLRALGCRTELLPAQLMVRRGMNPLTDYRLYRSYRKLLKRLQPDLVLTYTIKPDIYGAYACRKEGIPYISTVTGLGSVFEGDGIKKRLLRAVVVRMYRVALKECRCLFFQNGTNQQVFTGYGIRGKKQRLVNGSGVDLSLFRESPLPAAGDGRRGAPVQFAFIARILKEKGIEEFLTAAAKIKARYPMTTFHVCGSREADYRGRLDAAVRRKIVTEHGEIHGMEEFLQGIHCVVLPSYYPEGMNNVLQETSACGRVVITTENTGCREVVTDGITGFLVPMRDAEALAKAMERFLALSQEERTQMGHRARLKMEREFDRRKVTEAYLEEIRQVLHKGKKVV